MKKNLIYLTIGVVLGIILIVVLNRFYPLGNIFRSYSDNSVNLNSGNSFYDVTSKLDQGGDYYGYINTVRINRLIRDSLSGIREAVVKSKIMDSAGKKNMQQPFVLLDKVLNDIGLYSIDGAGSSIIKTKSGLFRSKLILHHAPGQDSGLIWKMFGKSSYKLKEIDLLPSNAVFASFSSLNFATVKSWIFDLAKSSGIKEFENGMKTIGPNLMKMGIDLDKLIDSVDIFSGIIVTLNKENMKNISKGDKKIAIPDPGLAIVLKVKNEYIFKLLEKMVPGMEKTEKDGMKILAAKGIPPLPITVKPQIVLKDNYLLFCSNTQISDDIFSALNGKNRISDKEEFRKLTEGISEKGNSFTFISRDLFKTISSVSRNFSGKNSTFSEFIKKIGVDIDEISVYRVMENGDDGIKITSNSTLEPEALILLPAVISAGVISSVAIPQIIKAKQQNMKPVPPPPPSLLHKK